MLSMVSNQGWRDERLQPHKSGMHSLKEADMLAARMDLVTKRLENCEKMSAQETLQAMDAHMGVPSTLRFPQVAYNMAFAACRLEDIFGTLDPESI